MNVFISAFDYSNGWEKRIAPINSMTKLFCVGVAFSYADRGNRPSPKAAAVMRCRCHKTRLDRLEKEPAIL
jgi:hypothetical protein